MTGPEHFREAERLIDQASEWLDSYADRRIADLAEAQVHATLALAAATALSDTDPNGSGMSVADYEVWYEAAGVTKAERPKAGGDRG